MSRTPKRRYTEAGEESVSASRGGVTVMDVLGDPGFQPPADVNETPAGMIVRMEIPGVAAGDIEVWIKGATIEVSGDKKRDPSCRDASFICLERAFGRFQRAFEVTGSLDMGRVTAVLKGGVLVLSIPKCDERRGRRRRIPVTSEREP